MQCNSGLVSNNLNTNQRQNTARCICRWRRGQGGKDVWMWGVAGAGGRARTGLIGEQELEVFFGQLGKASGVAIDGAREHLQKIGTRGRRGKRTFELASARFRESFELMSTSGADIRNYGQGVAKRSLCRACGCKINGAFCSPWRLLLGAPYGLSFEPIARAAGRVYRLACGGRHGKQI